MKVSFIPHHIGQTAMPHQDFNAIEQFEHISFPERVIPLSMTVKTRKTVKLTDCICIFPKKPQFFVMIGASL
jgi:hypothetical protein